MEETPEPTFTEDHRIITLIWHRTSNGVEILPDESLSYYDICGVISQALEMAADAIPDPECTCETMEQE